MLQRPAKLLPNPVLSAAFLLLEISPYLPYKLKCQVKDQKKTVFTEVNAVYTDGTCTFHNIVESDKGFKEVKPILRPLFDMMKEIEQDGQRFIPMVVLCRDFCQRIPENISFGGNTILMHADNGSAIAWWLVYHPEKMTFELADDSKEMNIHTIPQYKMFQKLFEWHFDVFGLIEKGQAVSQSSR